MKRLLFALTLSAAVALPALAQPTDSTSASTTPSTTAPSTPPPDGGGGPGGHHDRFKFLTDAEKAELKKAHDAAVAADPTLATEEKANFDAMKAARASGNPPSEDEKAKFKAFRDKLDAAEIKADPAVAPIIEKIKAHKPHGGPGGDKDGPPPAQ